jgi:hypothetical protein
MSGKLDLSGLPPEVRAKVELGLSKLSPEVRRQWEEKGSDMLARLVSGLAATPAGRKPPPLPKALARAVTLVRTDDRPARTATENVSPPRDHAPGPAQVIRRSAPHGHYNDTIAPGDSPTLLRRVLMGLAIAGGFAWWLQN